MRKSLPQLAIISDFREENWYSMDLVSEMLLQQLAAYAPEIAAQQFCPPMHLRFSRLGTRLARNADRFLNRYIEYPRWLRGQTGNTDLFHIIDHTYAHLALELPPERTVITCHDLDAFRPLLNGEHSKHHAWFTWVVRRVLKGLRRAGHVICVSETTRRLLVENGLLTMERTSVIPNGVAPGMSDQADPAADAEAAGLLGPRQQSEVLLLSVGSAIPRKRLDTLIQVFAAVRRQAPASRLVRVGESFTPSQRQLAVQLGVEGSIQTLPFLTRPVLAAVYRRAALLLLTSEREGFGLPLIEGMACGCPVVASDIPVFREVGGAVTEFCPVADVGIWAEKVLRLLEQRGAAPLQWRDRVQASRSWASQFSWEHAARRTMEIYRQMLKA